MDVVHTASAKASTSEPFTCAKCGYTGVGHAARIECATVEQGGVLFGNARAGEMARDEAEATAWQEAMSDVEMAACPRCGATDRASWLRWMTKPAYLTRGGTGVLVMIMGAMLCAATATAGNLFSLICAGVAGPVMLIAGPFFAVIPLRAKRAATRRVRYEPAK